MSKFSFTFVYGFALFAMFFGSGNLVFPLQIGYMSGPDWVLGFLGLSLTGILLPFLGLLVVKLHKGSYKNFFGEAGSWARHLVPLFTLSLMASFGVVPRCIIVGHAGFSAIFPGFPLWLFSLIFCAISFYFCLKDERLTQALGRFLSPVLLVTLMVLIGVGVWEGAHAETVALTTEQSPPGAFWGGFLKGYETMDLFAAFFFSAFIFMQIQRRLPPHFSLKQVLWRAVPPSLMGMGLLGLVYFGLVFLGSAYAPHLQGVAPENMLATVAQCTLGRVGMVILGVVVLFSCLTTAVALNNIYARYLSSFKSTKNSFVYCLVACTVVSYAMSLLDFKGIARILGPLLEYSYPSLIILTFFGLFTHQFHGTKKILFYGTIGALVGFEFLK